MDTTYKLNGGFKPTVKRFADLDGPDFFPIPRWATYALIDNEPLKGEIWECACGDCAMSEVLTETGSRIESSDLFDRGYGEIDHDFLTTTRRLRNVITNPPYNSAEGFVATGSPAFCRVCTGGIICSRTPKRRLPCIVQRKGIAFPIPGYFERQ
jgi:hypothetical protein